MIRKILITCPRCNCPNEGEVFFIDVHMNMVVNFTCRKCGYKFRRLI